MNNLGFASVALILLGAFIAGARDLSFDSYGYLVVLVSNITTAIYLTTIARIGATSSTSISMFLRSFILAFTLLIFHLPREI